MGNYEPQCPGEDITQNQVPESFLCPKCGGEVEIWSDENSGKCVDCKEIFLRIECLLREEA